MRSGGEYPCVPPLSSLSVCLPVVLALPLVCKLIAATRPARPLADTFRSSVGAGFEDWAGIVSLGFGWFVVCLLPSSVLRIAWSVGQE